MLPRGVCGEAASLELGCRFLSQALQRQPHRVIKVGGGEVGAAELNQTEPGTRRRSSDLYSITTGGPSP